MLFSYNRFNSAWTTSKVKQPYIGLSDILLHHGFTSDKKASTQQYTMYELADSWKILL